MARGSDGTVVCTTEDDRVLHAPSYLHGLHKTLAAGPVKGRAAADGQGAVAKPPRKHCRPLLPRAAAACRPLRLVPRLPCRPPSPARDRSHPAAPAAAAAAAPAAAAAAPLTRARQPPPLGAAAPPRAAAARPHAAPPMPSPSPWRQTASRPQQQHQWCQQRQCCRCSRRGCMWGISLGT